MYDHSIEAAHNPQIKHGKDGPYVAGLTSHPVSSAEEVRKRFNLAQKNRSTATTQMNDVIAYWSSSADV
jgi:hypothetical protein